MAVRCGGGGIPPPTHELTVDTVRVIETGGKRFVSVGLHKGDKLAESADVELRRRLALSQGNVAILIGKEVISGGIPGDMVYWQAEISGGSPGGEYALSGPVRPEEEKMTTVLLVYREGKLRTQTAYKPNEKPKSSFGGFFSLGVQHLVTGLDHILFVLVLVLAGSGFRSVAKIVTAFTLAHCFTLALVVLKGITMPSRIVEPIIALSIGAVAALNLLEIRKGTTKGAKRTDLKIPVAFMFGLIHGFGFAGGLIERGFEQGNVWGALLSFNIGLEVAQLGVALIGVGALWMLGTTETKRVKAISFASCVCAVASVAWFFQRILQS
jgi:hydrogenase/urease accessory protein HupE